MDHRIVRSVCPKDCPDTCGMLAQVDGGRVVRVTGDPDHPITRGSLCGRFQHYEDLIYHADRVLHPLLRSAKSEPLRRVSWAEALATIAARFEEIRARRGGAAILPYHYLAHMGIVSNRFADRLWNKLGTARVGMEICAMAGAEAVLRTLGRLRGTEPEHLDKTRLYIAWGKNPKETNIHGYMRTRGIHPAVVIDPRRSDSARAADLHIRPYPGTDAVLALGVMRVLLEQDWIDHAFIAAHTTGFERLRERILAASPEEVERVTRVPREQIELLARLYHEHRPGLIHIGVGLQRNLNGGEMVATIAGLAALTGQIGVPGAGVLYANMEWGLADISHPELRRDSARTYNMVTLGRDLTRNDDIEALFVYNSNPAATCPNQTQVARGLAREDLFVVVHDLFLTDTARHANVVLPACTFAEHMDLHFSYWHGYAQINRAVIEPVGEARSNYQVFRDLAHQLGFTEPCFRHSEREVITAALAGSGLSFEALERGPVLIDSMKAACFGNRRFPTPSGKMDLFVPAGEVPPLPPHHRLRFLTPKSKHLQSSQVFNFPRKQATLAVPWLFIHPQDAGALGIADGAPVRVWNERGSVRLVARVADDVQPGVVASHMVRWGHNANATTPDALADMGGNSAFHSNYVSVEADPSAGDTRESATPVP
ncbi:MAG: molybdopterin-dependent oxidoreductase [Gammaproteobacteria bacterium]|nr:molybdopterin-dependent oxidoreductase [Gammaproteobacteria bacterium]